MQFSVPDAETILCCLQDKNCTIKELEENVGGLSMPSKMPWYGYNLPATACHMGGMLHTIPGSVCSKCYARKGRYVFQNSKHAMQRRLQAVDLNLHVWAASMVLLISRKKCKNTVRYFRWHDSGDLQGVAHLEAIIWIAWNLPAVRFWLPTKEYALVQQCRAVMISVPNLCVRLSAPMIGGMLPYADVKVPTSSVAASSGFICPAAEYANTCGPCRACWDNETINVDYPLH